jgi:hypothetical protein
MVMFDALGTLAPASPRATRRRRRDWVRAEVRCLMCGRLLGRLLGTAKQRADGDRSAGQPVAFIAYRAIDSEEGVVAFTPQLRFRCQHCGGAGALDSIDVFSTYDEISGQDAADADGIEVRRGRGRPCRPFEPQPVGPTGLAAALQEV